MADLIDRRLVLKTLCERRCGEEPKGCPSGFCTESLAVDCLPSAQQEDYTELKREFLRMASYIDVLLECSDEQKETLTGFISRLAEFMPWTERD